MVLNQLVRVSHILCQGHTSRSECLVYCYSEVSCGPPPPLLNGQIFNSGSNEYEDTTTYACDTGYNIAGVTQIRLCLSSGVWNESDVHCERKLFT